MGQVLYHDLNYEAAAANLRYASQFGWPAHLSELDLGWLALAQGDLELGVAHMKTSIGMGAMENQAMAHVMRGAAYGVAVDTKGIVYMAGLTDGILPGQASAGNTDAFVMRMSTP